MARTVVITGAAGSIGRKLRTHFSTLGWTLRLLDVTSGGDAAVQVADLADYDASWAGVFGGVDGVIHLAGDPRPSASWESVQRLNIDLTANVLRAARSNGARRVVLASSNWVMAGYRFGSERLLTDMPPHPINPYGVSKLVGERMGRDAVAHGLSFVAMRIGWCQQTPGNVPGPHMAQGLWGQQMWLSDRDICNGMERAIEADGIDFTVLNLMSDNPGMRWDIDTTRRVVGYAPQDGHVAVITDEIQRTDAWACRARNLSADLEREVLEPGW